MKSGNWTWRLETTCVLARLVDQWWYRGLLSVPPDQEVGSQLLDATHVHTQWQPTLILIFEPVGCKQTSRLMRMAMVNAQSWCIFVNSQGIRPGRNKRTHRSHSRTQSAHRSLSLVRSTSLVISLSLFLSFLPYFRLARIHTWYTHSHSLLSLSRSLLGFIPSVVCSLGLFRWLSFFLSGSFSRSYTHSHTYAYRYTLDCRFYRTRDTMTHDRSYRVKRGHTPTPGC